MPSDQWPSLQSQRDLILEDYDSETCWGDRRQEIVFLGASMDEAAIVAQLDTALLKDDEMQRYEKQHAAVNVSPDAL